MPSNLSAYLAKNYLTASTPSSYSDEPPKKKRKKSKHHPETSGLTIADDEEGLSLSSTGAGADGDLDADAPVMFEGKVRSAEFRKAKQNAWKSLSGDKDEGHDAETRSKTTNPTANEDDADAILRTAQSDEVRRLNEQEAENAPAIVEMDTDTPAAPRVVNGLVAGLQTAADTARIMAAEEAREAAERKARKKAKKTKDGGGGGGGDAPQEEEEEETIYRDATGRRIDISMRRAEARREEAEKQRQKQQDRLDAMGEVQRREREERKRDLEDAKFLTLGRTVDDEDYNAHLKETVRWDDPMAAYMAEKRAEEEGGGDDDDDRRTMTKTAGNNGAVARARRKEYQGAAAPNRYGIKPGWRWDGVDRGNGFEKEWFQARSRKSRNEALSYEWQMDE